MRRAITIICGAFRWRAALCLCAALALGAPSVVRAQYTDTDKQNPSEYSDQDSHPLRVIAYILSPIGFALEWGIARPLHYIATDTFLAPVFNGERKEPPYRPPAIAEIPLDNVGDEPKAAPLTAAHQAPPSGGNYQPAPGSQPVIH